MDAALEPIINHTGFATARKILESQPDHPLLTRYKERLSQRIINLAVQIASSNPFEIFLEDKGITIAGDGYDIYYELFYGPNSPAERLFNSHWQKFLKGLSQDIDSTFGLNADWGDMTFFGTHGNEMNIWGVQARKVLTSKHIAVTIENIANVLIRFDLHESYFEEYLNVDQERKSQIESQIA